MQKGVIPLELFRLLGTIAINNKEANNALKDTADEGQKSEKKLSKSFVKIGKSALKIGTAMAGAAVAAGTALAAVAENTREYRTEMGKLEAAFTAAGHSSDAAKSTFNSLQAVLGETDQAVEASNHLAKLVDNEKDLQKWTDICDHLLRRHHAPGRYHHPGGSAGGLLFRAQGRSEPGCRRDPREAGEKAR